MIKQAAFALALTSTTAHATDYYFCWEGENGYTMTGQMSLAAGALDLQIVTENDVSEFRIAGYQDGILIGKWDAGNRAADDPWWRDAGWITSHLVELCGLQQGQDRCRERGVARGRLGTWALSTAARG